jgi:glutamate N-acetyltransferase/amino-acid N-acetyltransferase
MNNKYKFVEGGGVATATGFKASAVRAGFKAGATKDDLALVVSVEPAAAAGVFTQNVFAAPPVTFCREQLGAQSGGVAYGNARAIVINSGCANAATGVAGMEVCAHEADIVANELGCSPDEVLVASTGVIGVLPDVELFESGIPAAAAALSRKGGDAAAHAIMTTDTRAKQCAIEVDATELFGEAAYGDAPAEGAPTEGGALADTFPKKFYIGGMSKGSGMIMPNMATMIAVVTTDIPVAPAALHTALKIAVGKSFNKITVDSDTSTNDTCVAFANGQASALGVAPIDESSTGFGAFVDALSQVCVYLAREMAKDGEGATKLVTVNVRGARDEADADLAARTVANSPLVKTAIAGHDANWGRIAAALGRSGATFNAKGVDIDIMGIPVCRGGFAQGFDEDEALARFEQPEIVIDVNLGAGEAATTVWTCDLTHDYISINADYRS